MLINHNHLFFLVLVSLRRTHLDSSHLESHVFLVLYPLGLQSSGWLEHKPSRRLTHLAGKLLVALGWGPQGLCLYRSAWMSKVKYVVLILTKAFKLLSLYSIDWGIYEVLPMEWTKRTHLLMEECQNNTIGRACEIRNTLVQPFLGDSVHLSKLPSSFHLVLFLFLL